MTNLSGLEPTIEAILQAINGRVSPWGCYRLSAEDVLKAVLSRGQLVRASERATPKSELRRQASVEGECPICFARTDTGQEG